MLMPTFTGRLSTRLLLWTWTAARSSSKILARANAGLAMRRLSLSSSCERTSFTSTRFRRFTWSSQRPSCSSSCIGPSQSRWRPSSGALYSSGCIAPSKGFGRTGGRDGLWSDLCTETRIAADSDSEAHVGPCYGRLVSAFQPLSAAPQRLRGCADTLTSIFLTHHALRCQRICIVRVV